MYGFFEFYSNFNFGIFSINPILDYPYIISAKKIKTEEALKYTEEWVKNPTPLNEAGMKAVAKAKNELSIFEEDLKKSLKKEGLL